MVGKIIPTGEPVQDRRNLKTIAGDIELVAEDIGLACELLEDVCSASGAFPGDRLQRGKFAMLIYAIAAKARDLADMAAELEGHGQREVAHG